MSSEVKFYKNKTRSEALAATDANIVYLPTDENSIVVGGKEIGNTGRVYNENDGSEWKSLLTGRVLSSATGWYKIADIASTGTGGVVKIIGYLDHEGNYGHYQKTTRIAFQCAVRFSKGAGYLWIEQSGVKDTNTIKLVKTATNTFELLLGCNTSNNIYNVHYQTLIYSTQGTGTQFYTTADGLVAGTTPTTDNTVTPTVLNNNGYALTSDIPTLSTLFSGVSDVTTLADYDRLLVQKSDGTFAKISYYMLRQLMFGYYLVTTDANGVNYYDGVGIQHGVLDLYLGSVGTFGISFDDLYAAYKTSELSSVEIGGTEVSNSSALCTTIIGLLTHSTGRYIFFDYDGTTISNVKAGY